ncbi:alpha/beta hydrolase [Jidongwangia harbinensis]|uniref:alpha/beta hydrolase n=1 Tax=Jidongwangia harbinensis TaxID=2878561 RepID=UPI001CDA39C1|nr:alpha/beta hydrolase [Jidongwangia harbinensis]MCA2216185.1 alpha/beta hydrolase [Jidongwangia harbinensis]
MKKVFTTALTAGLCLVAAPATATPGTGGIAWHRCTLGPGDDTGRALDAAGVDCADVTVPLDHTRPRGRTITVAIARSRAPDPVHRIGALVLNLGGPASPVLSVVPDARAAIGAAGARFDLIGMDPRFAGRSTPIDCGWPAHWLPRSAGRDRRGFDRTTALARDLAARCGRTERALIPHASTANLARDLDRVRAALGDERLSYLGYSQGSYLGAVYAQLFPHRVDRMVLDSAIDPASPGTRTLRSTAPGREAALREWAAWAATRDAEHHLGTTAQAVLDTIHRVYAASARRPLRVGDFRVDDTVLPALLLGPLSDDADDDELATVVALLARAVAGHPAEPTEGLAERLASLLTGDGSARHSAQTAILCGDAPVSRDPEWYWRDVQAHRAAGPLFEPVARTVTPCAAWPDTPREAPVRVGNDVPALIVQAEKDVNSQLPEARALHRALTSSRLVVLTGARTHGVYRFRGAPCVDDTVDAYLVSGHLPRTDRDCAE